MNDDIDFCINSLRSISDRKDSVIKNLLAENSRINREMTNYKAASAFVAVAAVIAYALVGQC